MSKKESFRTVALKTYGRFVPAHVTSPKHRFTQRRSHQRRANIKEIKAASERGLMIRSRRAVSWLLPGLVVKRWLLTSGLGLLMALLGAAVWADLKPIYWILETLSWLLSSLTTVLPREITGPLVVLIGLSLIHI